MRLRPYLLLISFVIPISVIGLLVWQAVMLSYQHIDEVIPFRNDFLLTALVLIVGFFLVALTSTSYVEKKINKSLSSIKNILLQIVVGDDLPEQVLEKTPKDIAQMFLQIKQQLADREKLINQKAKNSIQQEKMEALSHLSASAAHEINNPLAAILGHAQIAKSKSQNLAVHNHLNIIEKEIRKIKDFVRNLMRFSRNTPTDYTPLNIKKVILESIDLMQHELAGKGIQIEKELLSTQEIYGDANKLQQIFINLMHNAIFAMEKSPEKVLSIHTQDANDRVHIEVKDTGVGMSLDVQEKIFEPFFTTKADGKGLGLSISFGIIKGHGGQLSVDSHPQQGTCFTIDLPCQIPTQVMETRSSLDENVISQDIPEDSIDMPSAIPEIPHQEEGPH